MKRTLIYTGLTIILFFIGFQIGNLFFKISLFELSLDEISLITTKMSTRAYNSLVLAIAIGLIPILHLLVKRITNAKSIQQSLKMIGIMILFGIVLWQFRILLLNALFRDLIAVKLGAKILVSFAIEKLKFEIWLAVGLIFGAVLNIIIFKGVKKNIKTSSL